MARVCVLAVNRVVKEIEPKLQAFYDEFLQNVT